MESTVPKKTMSSTQVTGSGENFLHSTVSAIMWSPPNLFSNMFGCPLEPYDCTVKLQAVNWLLNHKGQAEQTELAFPYLLKYYRRQSFLMAPVSFIFIVTKKALISTFILLLLNTL